MNEKKKYYIELTDPQKNFLMSLKGFENLKLTPVKEEKADATPEVEFTKGNMVRNQINGQIGIVIEPGLRLLKVETNDHKIDLWVSLVCEVIK